MTYIKKYYRPLTALLTIIIATIFLNVVLGTAAGTVRTNRNAPSFPESEAQIRAAFDKTVQDRGDAVVPFLIFDVRISKIEFDTTGQWASVWLEQHDPQTGDLIIGEPGLVLAHFDGSTWQIILQHDAAWANVLDRLPPDLMPEGNKVIWLERALSEGLLNESPTALGGYLLPWAEGGTLLLGRSIGHGGTGFYAFDFNTTPTSIFGLYASKGGSVHLAVWDYPNGYDDGSCANSNYIILKDESTNPVTYQLYLHLAFESIPQELRTIGASVVQGQYIGDADDTGCSTGHHIHYHVHTNPSSYWGTALDITFDDVPVNGGRPRTTGEANDPDCIPAPCSGQSYYTSQNVITDDTDPPTGGLFDPQTSTTVLSETVFMDGWAADLESGMDSAWFEALYNGTWTQISPPLTGLTFEFNWDMCSDGVPDGPVSVALTAKDQEGNLAERLDARAILKDFDCAPPPPACMATANQVAVFSEANYGGSCQVLEAGSHLLSMSPLGLQSLPFSDTTAQRASSTQVGSIMVGDDVLVTLYRDVFSGRAQTFTANDPNLSDDWIGVNLISLAYVQSDSLVPFGPPLPLWPAGETLSEDTSVSLLWDDGGGAVDFNVELTGPSGTSTSGWQQDPVWYPGSLSAGSYSFRIESRNDGGQTGYGATGLFTMTAGSTAPATETAPWTENFESGAWTSSGLWNRLDDSDAAHGGDYSYWYGGPAGDFDNGDYEVSGLPNAGSLTSPPISIPGGGYYLRWWSWYQTESDQDRWDQRWVQISADGGPFVNVYQLHDDPALYWRKSPHIDLSGYAGQTIEVRFHFESLDGRDNSHQGWLIDDISIDTTGPPSCPGANEPNDSPATATALSMPEVILTEICPAGDRDFYSFSGQAGDKFGVDIDAKVGGSLLDSYIYLLAADGRTIVAENDDEVWLTLLDSYLTTVLPEDGTYYLKVKAWNHPSVGSSSYWYTMTIAIDNDNPVLSGLSIADYDILASDIDLSVSATDGGTGVASVEFLYHTGDYANTPWVSIDVDTDSTGGWTADWDTSGLPESSGYVVLVKATDFGGNAAYLAAWHLTIDRTHPETTVVQLPNNSRTTAILLEWTTSDGSPIRHYDINQRIDGGDWESLVSQLDPGTNQLWILGQPGEDHEYRVRAVDEAGNSEPYANGQNETDTNILLCSAADVYEDDDAWTAASSYGDIQQIHNFCDHVTPTNTYDEDWSSFVVEAGTLYRFAAIPTSSTAATVLELYEADGTTLIAQAGTNGVLRSGAPDWDLLGQAAALLWEADANKTVLIRVYHAIPGIAGEKVTYVLQAGRFLPVYMPIVSR
jgi:hypothetical protein